MPVMRNECPQYPHDCVPLESAQQATSSVYAADVGAFQFDDISMNARTHAHARTRTQYTDYLITLSLPTGQIPAASG